MSRYTELLTFVASEMMKGAVIDWISIVVLGESLEIL